MWCLISWSKLRCSISFSNILDTFERSFIRDCELTSNFISSSSSVSFIVLLFNDTFDLFESLFTTDEILFKFCSSSFISTSLFDGVFTIFLFIFVFVIWDDDNKFGFERIDDFMGCFFVFNWFVVKGLLCVEFVRIRELVLFDNICDEIDDVVAVFAFFILVVVSKALDVFVVFIFDVIVLVDVVEVLLVRVFKVELFNVVDEFDRDLLFRFVEFIFLVGVVTFFNCVFDDNVEGGFFTDVFVVVVDFNGKVDEAVRVLEDKVDDVVVGVLVDKADAARVLADKVDDEVLVDAVDGVVRILVDRLDDGVLVDKVDDVVRVLVDRLDDVGVVVTFLFIIFDFLFVVVIFVSVVVVESCLVFLWPINDDDEEETLDVDDFKREELLFVERVDFFNFVETVDEFDKDEDLIFEFVLDVKEDLTL